jgi:putative protein-disulfide isomerase
MMPTIYYCYDAYCGWCYGFSPIIKQLSNTYQSQLAFEVLSGGMVITDTPKHIGLTASYIKDAYKTVEAHTGVKFGEDYLWHILNPDKSDWFPSSEKPAIAMCIFKELFPEQQVAFAADLQKSLYDEGRDLCDNEAYRHLLEKYAINETEFYDKLSNPLYKEKAYYEFALCKQLKVTGFPTLFLQVSESKFYLLARGYTAYDTLAQTLASVLQEISSSSVS